MTLSNAGFTKIILFNKADTSDQDEEIAEGFLI